MDFINSNLTKSFADKYGNSFDEMTTSSRFKVCIYKIDYSSKLVGSLNEFIIRDQKDNVLCTLTSSLSSQTNSKSFSKNYISKIMRDKQHDTTKIGHNFRKNN